jgi:hypothetical protein
VPKVSIRTILVEFDISTFGVLFIRLKEQVRQRAQCACEFCGITEIDAGGMLTIDRFQPRTEEGSDALTNLRLELLEGNGFADL